MTIVGLTSGASAQISIYIYDWEQFEYKKDAFGQRKVH